MEKQKQAATKDKRRAATFIKAAQEETEGMGDSSVPTPQEVRKGVILNRRRIG